MGMMIMMKRKYDYDDAFDDDVFLNWKDDDDAFVFLDDAYVLNVLTISHRLCNNQTRTNACKW